MPDIRGIGARPYLDFDYPLGTRSALAGGVWPAGAEAFRVEEIGLYPFSGVGEHAALTVEKRSRATRDVAVAVAQRLGVPAAAVGYAGMKDKDCVSVQAFTVTGVGEEEARSAFEAEGCRVLAATRHGNKLRVGHLLGNRFEVLLAGADPVRAEESLRRLGAGGVPNYYGPQRFGARGDNAAQGLEILRGRARVGRWKRDLFVSALQSAVFNEVLSRRIEDGLLGTALAGDVLRKEDSGGMFVSEDPEVDGPRVEGFEVSPTGPIPGRKMMEPKGLPAEREASVLRDLGLDPALFSKETGSRRPLRARVEAYSVRPCAEGVWLAFTCPAGVYATSVVREITGKAVRGV